jgi:hypothetical protein
MVGKWCLYANNLEEEDEEKEKTYMIGPPINIHWVEATVLTATAITSLGMLGILHIVMWLIQQGPILVQPNKQAQPTCYKHSAISQCFIICTSMH